jgi:hypothetical protein
MIRQVRLELARCHEFPEGSSAHGYSLALPLTQDGYLDKDELHRHREPLHFSRFWGSDNEGGVLRHGHRGWVLALGSGASEEDEVLFKGDRHRFAEGDYVSIAERDGETRTFRVAAVK